MAPGPDGDDEWERLAEPFEITVEDVEGEQLVEVEVTGEQLQSAIAELAAMGDDEGDE